jgi:NAD(P)-dependent dehydrogenase (short-subunit alcohol dehydrogenase family)
MSNNPFDLTGRTAIVTGGNQGLGRAFAFGLAAAGAHVAIAGRSAERNEKVVAEAAAEGFTFEAITADITEHADIERMTVEAIEKLGKIDILVNNAGRGILGTVVTTSEDDWDDIIAVNLKSVYLCSKFVVPVMKSNGGGVIVNLASTISVVGIPDRAAYVASKGGVASLTRAMALDHAGDNIRINSVAPGVIWSSYYDQMLKQVPDPEDFKKGLRDRAPMGRVGEPAEIAGMIAWLASDESSFATGAMFTVDGGYTAR